MSRLEIIACPSCKRPMTESEDTEIRAAGSFKDCIRRCEACGIGASNGDRSHVTFIYSEPLMNIPKDCRDGAKEVLARALNVQSRGSKLRRFGFSTSEDAVTWVVFTYLLRANRLLATLRRAELARLQDHCWS